jgi:hypothetical protein
LIFYSFFIEEKRKSDLESLEAKYKEDFQRYKEKCEEKTEELEKQQQKERYDIETNMYLEEVFHPSSEYLNLSRRVLFLIIYFIFVCKLTAMMTAKLYSEAKILMKELKKRVLFDFVRDIIYLRKILK